MSERTTLLNALKARFYYLVAEDVLSSAEGWWKHRGFVLLHPAAEDDEEDVVGTYGDTPAHCTAKVRASRRARTCAEAGACP